MYYDETKALKPFLFKEFFKKLPGFFFYICVRQPVFSLVEEHNGIGAAKLFGNNMLIKPIRFAQYTLKIIAVYRLLKVFFRHRYAHLQRYSLRVFYREINQSQRVFGNRRAFGEKLCNGRMAFQLFSFRVSKSFFHIAKVGR